MVAGWSCTVFTPWLWARVPQARLQCCDVLVFSCFYGMLRKSVGSSPHNYFRDVFGKVCVVLFQVTRWAAPTHAAPHTLPHAEPTTMFPPS